MIEIEQQDGMTRWHVHGTFWMGIPLAVIGFLVGIGAAGAIIGHICAWVWLRSEGISVRVIETTENKEKSDQ